MRFGAGAAIERDAHNGPVPVKPSMRRFCCALIVPRRCFSSPFFFNFSLGKYPWIFRVFDAVPSSLLLVTSGEIFD